MRRGRFDRFASRYLIGQALAVVAWWVALFVQPTFRGYFLSPSFSWDALRAFLVPDLIFLVLAGLRAGLELRNSRRNAQSALMVHVVGSAYASIFCLSSAALGQMPWLGAAAMAPYLLIGPYLVARLRP